MFNMRHILCLRVEFYSSFFMIKTKNTFLIVTPNHLNYVTEYYLKSFQYLIFQQVPLINNYYLLTKFNL